jgi:hypothetical protein
MIKAVAPSMAQRVIDAAIQIHGGAGVSQDTLLPHAFAMMRCLRIADGPDEVHVRCVCACAASVCVCVCVMGGRGSARTPSCPTPSP